MASVTISEIAKQSGVSHQTVSRILNGKGDKHKASTVEHVMSVATEMGYRPNTAARSMRSGRTGTIALLHDLISHRSDLPVGLLNGIHAGIDELDFNLTLARFSDERLTDDEFVPKILREVGADGLLLNFHTDPPKQMQALISQYSIPSVWINLKRDLDAIYLDDLGASKQLTNTFLAGGHHKIAYLDSNYDNSIQHYSRVDRLAGYKAAMEGAGIPAQMFIERVSRVKQAQAVLDSGATAVVGYSDYDIQALAQLLWQQGKKPGEDVRFGFFSPGPNYYLWPATIMALQHQILGKQALDMLWKKIQTDDELPSQSVAFDMIHFNP